MNGGLHHYHARKRREPYPARTKWLRYLDRAMIIIALFSPIALMPQVIQVFAEKNVEGLSIYTWVTLALLNIIWTVYGIVHKDKPIIIASVFVAILQLSVVIAILQYGT